MGDGAWEDRDQAAGTASRLGSQREADQARFLLFSVVLCTKDSG